MTPFGSAYSVDGGNLAGAAAAWTNGSFFTYQITTLANTPGQITLNNVQLGTYNHTTHYPFRITVVISTSPTFDTAVLLVDNEIVPAASNAYFQYKFPMQVKPVLQNGTTYYIRAIVHDSTATSTPTNTLRWDDFRVDAGTCNADVMIFKSNGTTTVTSGSTTTYSLLVNNSGGTTNGVVVRDVVGSGLTCPTGNSVSISGDGVPAGSFTIGDLTGAGITLGTLANGQSTTLTYSCSVN